MSAKTKENEIVPPMIIVDPEDGREYTLEFTVKSVKKTEAAGFVATKIDEQPMIMIPLLFWGAFQAHHPWVTREKAEKLLTEGLGGLEDEELDRLGSLYANPYKAIIRNENGETPANPRKVTVKL